MLRESGPNSHMSRSIEGRRNRLKTVKSAKARATRWPQASFLSRRPITIYSEILQT
jgi:hypothetical protein